MFGPCLGSKKRSLADPESCSTKMSQEIQVYSTCFYSTLSQHMSEFHSFFLLESSFFLSEPQLILKSFDLEPNK